MFLLDYGGRWRQVWSYSRPKNTYFSINMQKDLTVATHCNQGGFPSVSRAQVSFLKSGFQMCKGRQVCQGVTNAPGVNEGKTERVEAHVLRH